MIATVLGWIGLSKKTATIIGIVVVLAIGAAIAWWIQSLRADSKAYKTLKSEIVSLETKYACKDRSAVAGGLTTCLLERDNEIQAAKIQAQNQILESAARAQDELHRMNQQVLDTQASLNTFVRSLPKSDDGPLPAVVTKYWERLRAGR